MADGRAPEPAVRAGAESTLGLVTFACGDPEAAVAIVSTAARRAEEAGDLEGRLRALAVYANAAADTPGDAERAQWAADQVMAADTAGSPLVPVARATATLALVRLALAAGEHERADELLRSADLEVERAGASWLRVLWLNISVLADQARERHDRTLPRLRRSIVLSRQLRDAPAVLYGLVALGVDLVLRGRPLDAARAFGAADAHGERTGQRITDPASLRLLAAHRARAQELVGADEFEGAVAAGAAMTPEEALDRAG